MSKAKNITKHNADQNNYSGDDNGDYHLVTTKFSIRVLCFERIFFDRYIERLQICFDSALLIYRPSIGTNNHINIGDVGPIEHLDFTFTKIGAPTRGN